MNEENVLFQCFLEVFNNKEFLSHYDEKKSYFFKNRPELLEIGKYIY
jgi:hypothetical protein